MCLRLRCSKCRRDVAARRLGIGEGLGNGAAVAGAGSLGDGLGDGLGDRGGVSTLRQEGEQGSNSVMQGEEVDGGPGGPRTVEGGGMCQLCGTSVWGHPEPMGPSEPS